MQSEQIVSLNKFVTDANKFVKTLNTTQKPLILTQDDAAVAILQDIKQYHKLLNALYMLKLMVQGEKDIQEGKGHKQSEVFEEIDRILETKVE